jgi:hypothetical protein
VWLKIVSYASLLLQTTACITVRTVAVFRSLEQMCKGMPQLLSPALEQTQPCLCSFSHKRLPMSSLHFCLVQCVGYRS